MNVAERWKRQVEPTIRILVAPPTSPLFFSSPAPLALGLGYTPSSFFLFFPFFCPGLSFSSSSIPTSRGDCVPTPSGEHWCGDPFVPANENTGDPA